MTLRLSSPQQELLKWIAVALMVLDHIGMFFEGYEWTRQPGRLVYPIFAFLAAYNYLYNTKNKERYLIRLMLWALVAQPIYSVFVFYSELNILFTILLGLFAVHIVNTQKGLSVLWCLLVVPLAYFTSYGVMGVLLVLAFYLALKDRRFLALPLVCLALLNAPKFIFFTMLSIPLILMMMRLKGVSVRVSGICFYAFYPAHLAVFGFILLANQYFLT